MVGNNAYEDTIAEALEIKVFLLTDCLINKTDIDIYRCPHGSFDQLMDYCKRPHERKEHEKSQAVRHLRWRHERNDAGTDGSGVRCGRKPYGIARNPNLVITAMSEDDATTHMRIVTDTIEYLRTHGFWDICNMKGSWVGDSTARAFSMCGYPAISKRCSVPLYDL